MAGSPALLLLLSLGLCCTGAQGQRDAVVVRFPSRTDIQPQEGQRLELDCWRNTTSWKVTWIRLDKHGSLHFILSNFISNTTTFYGGERTSLSFEASWREKTSRLVVKSFREEDEGIYFCINDINLVLHFSSGQPAFFPVTTTSAPTTPAATNQSSQISKTDICMQSSDPGTSNKNMLNFYCEIYIWAPLAGVCLVLLVVLVVTIVLCQKTRRRRCRCKRPPNGKPGAKPSVPTRHI
ncbi:T-cell surface glycoprotein CD8 alpha chain isoform X4 [Lagopus muta]|uniref:T-cell surface glycoprotein CD8 alpha chain isoform X4 n=1 Tax=Lagopus muta TaxID=64668 RepID=UPI0020A0E014|nr:T-cell surface glycoprotein CD8 alpha chain isoform X4 [Lagopus muta]